MRKILLAALLVITIILLAFGLYREPIPVTERPSQACIICFSGGVPIFEGVASGGLVVDGDVLSFYSMDIGSQVYFTSATCMYAKAQ